MRQRHLLQRLSAMLTVLTLIVGGRFVDGLAQSTSASPLVTHDRMPTTRTREVAAVPQPETQAERDARIARLEISPRDVVLELGQTVIFVAAAYDASNATVGGVAVTWHASHMEQNREVPISRQGEFFAEAPGVFQVRAENGEHVAVTTVTVIDSSNPPQNAPPVPGIGDEPGWDETNDSTAFEPRNRRGSTPNSQAPATSDALASADVEIERLQEAAAAGSSNFQLATPIVHLPGRGLDVALNLNYNSRVWTMVNYEQEPGDEEGPLGKLYFDLDADWPAPGWSLGFGKLVRTAFGTGMLVDPDGTRHPFKRTSLLTEHQGYNVPGDVIWSEAFTTDNSLINYRLRSVYRVNTDVVWGEAKYPNGTIVTYSAPNAQGDALYATQITDASGNTIKIAYVNNAGPQIERVQDTLGRAYRFHYDEHNLLTAVTGPGLQGGTYTHVRLHYVQRSILYWFNPRLEVKAPRTDQPRWLLDAIVYPATGTGFWFGEAKSPERLASISDFGMVRRVSERRGMHVDLDGANWANQGTIQPGSVTREREYNYPDRPERVGLNNAPDYDVMNETWEGLEDTATVTTTYEVVYDPPADQCSDCIRTKVTYPDETSSVTLSRKQDGLVIRQETYDAENRLLQASTVDWEQGDYESARPKRTTATDELGQTRVTTYGYGGRNQVIDVREYDYNGTVPLRWTTTQYVSAPEYEQNHIFNLPEAVDIYSNPARLAGAEGPDVRLSRTEYTYDRQELRAAPNVIMHDDQYDPDAPPIWIPEREVCEVPEPPIPEPEPPVPDPEPEPECRIIPGFWRPVYDPRTAFRGNVTQTTTYRDANVFPVPIGPITALSTYDITGNVIESEAAGQRIIYTYTDATEFAFPEASTLGGLDRASPVRLSTATSYDFNTGLVRSITDANGLTNAIEYAPETLRPWRTTSPTGAFTIIDYDDAALKVTTTGYDAGGALAEQSVRWLNGLGLPRRSEVLVEGGFWNVVEQKYDHLGRLSHETLPFRQGAPQQWSQIHYDALGRVHRVIGPDGSETWTDYNTSSRPPGASNEPGQTQRVRDAWSRERWLRTNALGQLVEVVEPNPVGSGSVDELGHMVTTYQYDALGRLTRVQQGAQRREFRYDSLGRLTHQYLPERRPRLDDTGIDIGIGGRWSDVYTYDERSNRTSHTDARGVKTIFDYANDPLNRLQGVRYDTAGSGDTANPIEPAPNIRYVYMPDGNQTRLFQVIAEGVITETLGYDDQGRLKSRQQVVAGREAYPQVIGYDYDSLDRPSKLWLPYQKNGDPPRWVGYDYGVGSQLKRLHVVDVNYASEMLYNAAGQLTSMKVGPALEQQVTESYDYDTATGLLNGQRVLRGGGSLLDLAYGYTRAGSGAAQTGQVTTITDNLDGRKNRNYAYDALRRLARVSGGAPTSPLWAQEYRYDEYGNRTGVTAIGTAANGAPMVPDGSASVMYENESNRIAADGYQYDAAGNATRDLQADGTWQRYRYDAAGRLAKVLDDANQPREFYIYGADRRRLATHYGEGSGDRTYYVWDGNVVVAEYTETGTAPGVPLWSRSYVYLGGRLLATVGPGSDTQDSIKYHHPDRRGTRLVTQGAEPEVTEQVTLPFGVFLPAESNGVPTNRIFSTYDRNPSTGLDYAVNRYYGPQQGRFMQADPLGIAGVNLGDPQSLNMYAYVTNDPVNATDVLGLDRSPKGCLMSGNPEDPRDGCGFSQYVLVTAPFVPYMPPSMSVFSEWWTEDPWAKVNYDPIDRNLSGTRHHPRTSTNRPFTPEVFGWFSYDRKLKAEVDKKKGVALSVEAAGEVILIAGANSTGPFTAKILAGGGAVELGWENSQEKERGVYGARYWGTETITQYLSGSVVSSTKEEPITFWELGYGGKYVGGVGGRYTAGHHGEDPGLYIGISAAGYSVGIGASRDMFDVLLGPFGPAQPDNPWFQGPGAW